MKHKHVMKGFESASILIILSLFWIDGFTQHDAEAIQALIAVSDLKGKLVMNAVVGHQVMLLGSFSNNPSAYYQEPLWPYLRLEILTM